MSDNDLVFRSSDSDAAEGFSESTAGFTALGRRVMEPTTPSSSKRHDPVTPHSVRARRRLTTTTRRVSRLSKVQVDPLSALRMLSRVLSVHKTPEKPSARQDQEATINANSNVSSENGHESTKEGDGDDGDDDDANRIMNTSINAVETDIDIDQRSQTNDGYEKDDEEMPLQVPLNVETLSDTTTAISDATPKVVTETAAVQSPERYRSRQYYSGSTYALDENLSSIMFRQMELKPEEGFSDDSWMPQRHEVSDGSLRFEISDSVPSSMMSSMAPESSERETEEEEDDSGRPIFDDPADDQSMSQHEEDQNMLSDRISEDLEGQTSLQNEQENEQETEAEPELAQRYPDINVPRPITVGDDATFVEPTMSASDVRMQNLLRPRRTRRGAYKTETAVPKKNIRDIIRMVSSSKIPADALEEIISVSDQFFRQTMEGLVGYADQNKRKTVEAQDVIKLMRHQRLTNTTKTPFSLAHKYLPAELVEAVISETN